MSLLTVILVLAAAGILAYLLTKVNKLLGALVTILAPLYALVVFLVEGDSLVTSGALGFIRFQGSSLGWFFALIMLIVYGTVAFFNPYWMKKLLHPASYNLLYLLSLAGTLGVFFSENFMGLFIFWEIVVWSSLFIIPQGKSRNASVVYYAMSTFGSFTMLYAIFMLYMRYDSFMISEVMAKAAGDSTTAIVAFILIGLAGLVKLGVFPFHIWLPMAHGNAPDTFSPILSGGLVKLGAFAALIVTALMPSYEAFSDQITIMGMPMTHYIGLVIGAISIVVGTLMAISQDDAKKLLAYSSVANGGYILVGILLNDGLSTAGALMHVFAHAMASAAAFLAIAAVSYRTGTTKMSELGGLIHRMPITYLTYLIAIISMAGIPPMAGFISKWMLFQSMANKGLILISAAAFFGSVGSFLYVFRPLSAVFLGQLKPKHDKVKEVPALMILPMAVLSLITLFFGVVPNVLLNYINRILGYLNIEEVTTMSPQIAGTNGVLDPTLVTIVFGIGFVIALIIFLLMPKSKKVGLMDTYTAG